MCKRHGCNGCGTLTTIAFDAADRVTQLSIHTANMSRFPIAPKLTGLEVITLSGQRYAIGKRLQESPETHHIEIPE